MHAEHDTAQHGCLHKLKVFILWHIAAIPKAYFCLDFRSVVKQIVEISLHSQDTDTQSVSEIGDNILGMCAMGQNK